MRVLVTGAEGFIGRHLVGELAGHGHDVVGVDRRHGDLRKEREARSWVADVRPDVVVHLAAKVGRQFGEADVEATIRDNAVMTAHVARACAAVGARLVYASTSEVYGDQGDRVCVEGRSDGKGRVHNLYGLSKGWGEQVAGLYAPEGLTVLRLSMPYGPGLPWGRGRAAIINMLWQALTGRPIPVHRGAERCWCWVGDTVAGIRLTIERSAGGVFNVGRDDNRVLMEDVARLACLLAGASADLIEMVDAPADQTVVKRLSNDRLRALGWEPTVELDDGMLRCLEWIREEMAVAEEVAA